jgi:hypothetical protein
LIAAARASPPTSAVADGNWTRLMPVRPGEPSAFDRVILSRGRDDSDGGGDPPRAETPEMVMRIADRDPRLRVSHFCRASLPTGDTEVPTQTFTWLTCNLTIDAKIQVM